MARQYVVLVGMVISSLVRTAHGDCESIIGLSKIVSTTTSDKTSLEQHATNFCNEYRSHHGESDSFNFGASFEFLSLSFGSSSATVDEVASRYCSASSNYSVRGDAYRQYIEAIAPGAFDAYKSCVEFSGKDLTFNVNEGSILPTDFTMTASFTSHTAGVKSANVEASASSGVTCKWSGTNSAKKNIPTGGSEILTCSRTNQEKKASVTIVGTSIAAPPMVMPWKAYDRNGIPIDTIVSLSNQLRTLKSEVDGVNGNLRKIDFQSGVVSIVASSGSRPLTDGSKCDANSGNDRGQLSGRVVFAKPFLTTPVVSMGIVNLDIGKQGLRINAEVTKVDTTGFNYRFNTWCDTIVYGGAASWAAMAR